MTTTTGVPIVFADSETDSLDPRTRQPWDIALIRREPDGTETEYQFFVELNLSTSDPFALKIGRFHDRHPLGRWCSRRGTHGRPAPKQPPMYSHGSWLKDRGEYLTRAHAAERIARITHGAHIVGAIPSFDTITMEPLLWEAGLAGTWHHHIVDVEALAVGYLQGRLHQWTEDHPDTISTDWQRERLAPPWKSDHLHAMLDLEPIADEDRHTALGDARWARSFYDKIMGTSARAPEPLAARADALTAADLGHLS